MDPVEAPIPRYDFYQTLEHLILSLYIKGYGGSEVRDKVGVVFEGERVTVELPSLSTDPSTDPKRFILEPLMAAIVPEQSSYRVLSTKIELKLAKARPENWSALLSAEPIAASHSQSEAGPSTNKAPDASSGGGESTSPAGAPAAVPKGKPKKNWDKLVEDDNDDNGVKDPNEGGDAALKNFFAKIYGNADDDTKRAMIKSYTESGGTALSTDWNKIGKEKTEIRPPEGMEARKYD